MQNKIDYLRSQLYIDMRGPYPKKGLRLWRAKTQIKYQFLIMTNSLYIMWTKSDKGLLKIKFEIETFQHTG